MIQLHVNKEMCVFLHNCFHYFVHLLYVRCRFKKDCIDRVSYKYNDNREQLAVDGWVLLRGGV